MTFIVVSLRGAEPLSPSPRGEAYRWRDSRPRPPRDAPERDRDHPHHRGRSGSARAPTDTGHTSGSGT